MRFYFIILMLVLMPFQANADATRQAMKLIERTTAQGACASYIGYMGTVRQNELETGRVVS